MTKINTYLNKDSHRKMNLGLTYGLQEKNGLRESAVLQLQQWKSRCRRLIGHRLLIKFYQLPMYLENTCI